ncbi:hypothetical protein LCGC14_0792070 [marine sediment metagenome]|uniref:Uncharacterized protein n=1 Tax=marine sediment metagenome TaxID=412755 RepID=A0A0F9QC25_9ZZZZ
MKQQTKFGRGTTLNQAIKELEENGSVEIIKVTNRKGEFIFEYEVGE